MILNEPDEPSGSYMGGDDNKNSETNVKEPENSESMSGTGKMGSSPVIELKNVHFSYAGGN